MDDNSLTSSLHPGKRHVITLAPWQLWLARRSPEFASYVRNADAVTIDGRWLKACLDISGRRYPLLTGRSVVQWHYAGDGPQRIAVIGSSDESLAKLSVTKPDWLCIGGEFSEAIVDARLAEVVDEIRRHRSSLVFVALGSPKQELWGRLIADLAGVTVVGIGGSIETVVGLRKAPSGILQRLGLEWLQRTVQDPERFVPRIVQAFSVLPKLLLEAVVTRLGLRK
ncbi:WecB/TagA/CpsF family glycosyltransferase [Pseudarthrobacter oxydans]|uniref:WecB/TagA/CpsF family glycosyltransferase n=1 Tax=Pseudarthrobacter oxydans TaxID=1671 RepID=UPI0037F4748B